MPIKSVLFLLLISSICAAQGKAEPKRADAGLAATTEDSMLTALRQRAEVNDPEAQTKLGQFYEQGHGVRQDYGEALALYRKAADQGYWGAQYRLARMYDEGVGVIKDRTRAIDLYRQVIQNGAAGTVGVQAAMTAINRLTVAANSSASSALPVSDQESGDPNQASTRGEVSLADTLDFIKRKLSEPRKQNGWIECADGRPQEDQGTTTWKVAAFENDANLLAITQEFAKPDGGRHFPATKGTLTWKFRLDQLDPTGVTVQKGFPQAGCVLWNTTWYVMLKASGSNSAENTWDVETLLSPAECQKWTTHTCHMHSAAEDDTLYFAFEDKQTAARVAKAFVHAIILASPEAKPDVF